MFRNSIKFKYISGYHSEVKVQIFRIEKKIEEKFWMWKVIIFPFCEKPSQKKLRL